MDEQILTEWQVRETDFPASASPREQLAFLVRYAVLAPSGHNTQPWLFRLKGEQLELLADRRKALPVVDPENRELIISCGAALFLLRTALRHFGYAGEVELLPDPGEPELLARIRLGARRPAQPEEERLFEAIPHRHTTRLTYEKRELPGELVLQLRDAARDEGAWLEVVEPGARESVAELVAEGNRLQAANREFRRELATWMHPDRSRIRDGMRGYSHGMPGLVSYLVPHFLRTFNWGALLAKKDRQLALDSPLLAVLGTEEDSPRAWLSAGQALAHLLLRASTAGVRASFLNQPIEVPSLRPRLAALLSQRGMPQLLLRMGYGPEVYPSPRRPVEEVLQ